MSKKVQPHVLKQFLILRQMGSGAYGHVWQVQDRKTKNIFALKKVFDAFRNSTDAQRTYREVQFLFKLNHVNIIKLHRVIKANNLKDLYLVFQFMESDLHSLVGTKVLQKQHKIYVFYQILCGIKYLHSGELIHRDLKPSNVLISSDCTVKLCDFGLIRSLLQKQNEQQIMTQEVATKWYRAPQLLLGSTCYGKPVDLWSAGCIFAQILLGKPLFAGDSTLGQLQKIIQFTGPLSNQDIQSIKSPQIKVKQIRVDEIMKKIDRDFHQLILCLIQPNPNKRFTVDQALSLPIFQQFCQFKRQVLEQYPVSQLNDNVKFDMTVYRQKLYQMIEQRNKSANFLDPQLKLCGIKRKSQSCQTRQISQNKSNIFKKSLQESRSRNLSRPVKKFGSTHSYQKFANSKENILKSYSNSDIKCMKAHYRSLSNIYQSKLKNMGKIKQKSIGKSQISSKYLKNQVKIPKQSSIYVTNKPRQTKASAYLFKKSVKPNMFRKLMDPNVQYLKNERTCSSKDQRRISYKIIR